MTAVDLNGDRSDDLVASAVQDDANGQVHSGSVFVINGGSNIASRDLGAVAPDRRFDGAAAGDLAGSGLAAVGDVNKDGGQDLVIGASFAGNNSRIASGSVYVIFGAPVQTPPPVTPTPQMNPAATLSVVARKAGKAVPRNGKVAWSSG